MGRVKFGQRNPAEVCRKREGAEALANLRVVHVKFVIDRTAHGRVKCVMAL